MLFTSLLSILSIPAALAGSLDVRQTLPGNQIFFNNANSSHCLQVDIGSGTLVNGSPVVSTTCNNTQTQEWVINRGSTKVQLIGTNFCLDAGSNPGNGVLMKVWECFDNLPAQAWFFTGDNRIALENQGLCLDLPNGNLNPGTRVQTWQCTDFNTNQIWTI